MNLSVVIVAAGSGRRFGSKEPKQFLTLNKKPMFLWSVLAFKKIKDCKQIILVVSKEKIHEMLKYKKIYGVDVVCGGKERFDSVKNGLNIVNRDADFVAVHDAARPCLIHQTEYLLCQTPPVPVHKFWPKASFPDHFLEKSKRPSIV